MDTYYKNVTKSDAVVQVFNTSTGRQSQLDLPVRGQPDLHNEFRAELLKESKKQQQPRTDSKGSKRFQVMTIRKKGLCFRHNI